MLKALLRTRIYALGAWFSGASRTTKPSSKLKTLGIGAIMIYACFAFMFMFGLYFGQIAEPFYAAGLGWLYFSLFILTAFTLMFVGSIFVSKSQLYEAKDNEMLLSMPIPPKYILASRMVMLLILNLIFELLVAIPAFVMWAKIKPFTVGSIVSFILIILTLPFLSLALSSFFGWIIALFTGKIRNKSFFTVMFSIVFLFLYFYFFNRANTLIQMLIFNSNAIAASLSAIAPIFWIGNAIIEPNIIHLILSICIFIIPFSIMYIILSSTYIYIATTNRGFVKIKYQHKPMHKSSHSTALFRREFKRLLSSPVYILNSGLGVIFAIAGAIALIIKNDTVLELKTQLGFEIDNIVTLLILAICLLSSTILFTAPSLSLEGKTLWIIKSLPLKTKNIFKAKLNLHRYIAFPAIVFLSIVSVIVFSPSPVLIIPLIIIPILFIDLSAKIGLICNLKYPNFTWINETQAVKQSMSVILAMLANAAVVIIPGALYFWLFIKIGAEIFLYSYIVLIAAVSVICGKWIKTKGVKIFEDFT